MLPFSISPVQRSCIALLTVGIFSSSLSPLGRAQTDQGTLQRNDDRANAPHVLNTAEKQKTKRTALDWVEKASLTPEQRETSRRSCTGAYVQPKRQQDDAKLNPAYAELRGEADRSQINMETHEAILEGDVIFTQGWRQVLADRVVVNQEQNNYKLEGNVSIREPGFLVESDTASVLGEDNSLNATNATYLIHDQGLRGSAKKMSRSENGELTIEGATYTSCEPEDEAWVMETSKLAINEETGRIYGRDVVIKTAGIPVFYTPYISFPYDDRRQSGILYPTIKNRSDDGLDLTLPIYWNIRPDQDATFTPRVIQRRGVVLGTEHRFLSDSTYTESRLNYSPEDTSGDRNDLYSSTPRWLLDLNHQGYVKGFWTEWDLARVSDIDYFEDYGASFIDEASASTLSQFGALGYQTDQWSLSLLAETFQSLVVGASNQYRRLPELDIEGQGQLQHNFWWSVDYQLSRFDHASDDVANAVGFQRATDGTWVTGTRLRNELLLGWRNESDWYHFEPAIGLDYLYYNLDNPLEGQTSSTPSELAPSLSLDLGFAFERQASFFGDQFVQTLEPEFFYLVRDVGDQNDIPVFDTTRATRSYDLLFRRNSFVGGDRLSDTHQLTLGLSSSLYDPKTGDEKARFRLAQALFIEDRETHLSPEILADLTDPNALAIDDENRVAAIRGRETLNELGYNRSETIATLDLKLTQRWRLESEVLWDSIESSLDRSQIGFSYEHPNKERYLDLSYFRERDVAYLRDRDGDGFSRFNELITEDVEQGIVSGAVEWGENWSVTARWQFDFSNHRTLDSGLGVTYSNCCWNLSTTWRRWLQRDDDNNLFIESLRHESGIFVGFEWVGLGGIGQSPADILRRQRVQ